MMFHKDLLKLFLIFSIIRLLTCLKQGGGGGGAKKTFSVEVYPSEQDEDTSVFAGDDLYRANLRSMWNNVNPYYSFANNPFMMPAYMPMYGYSQPVMPGNYFMSTMGQTDPINYNYPKMANIRGSQYNNYPKFKETKNRSQVNNESANLAKELEKQIKELQTLTKEAKDIAKKKLTEEKTSNNHDDPKLNKSTFLEIKNNSENNPRRSNLDKLSLNRNDKNRFDETIKNVIKKLDDAS